MTDIMELMRARRSVRTFTDREVPPAVREELDAYAEALNREGGLTIRLFYDEPDCYNSFMAHYGKIVNCRNYIVMGGKKAPDLEERCGYYGEKLVLKAQELGLNTCWTALSHGKSKAVRAVDEKEVIFIALGYGATQGNARNSRTAEQVSNVSADSPAWFKKGVEAALLAPTAMNQQKFTLTLTEKGTVSAKAGLLGPCLKIDLGIVKCHFELAAGKENFRWM